MKKVSYFLVLLFTAILLHITASTASAQNYTCTYNVTNGCRVGTACPAGFHDECASMSPASCQIADDMNQTFPCVADSASCGALGQACCTPGNTCNGALICAGNRCVNNVATSTPMPTSPGGGSLPGNSSSPVRGNCIDTAIGCIPVFDPSGTRGFMTFVLAWGVGVAGGVALLLIIYAGFQIMTSAGNPQKLQAGKELLGAAISGVLLLIFSTFILRFVGVDILRIF